MVLATVLVYWFGIITVIVYLDKTSVISRMSFLPVLLRSNFIKKLYVRDPRGFLAITDHSDLCESLNGP